MQNDRVLIFKCLEYSGYVDCDAHACLDVRRLVPAQLAEWMMPWRTWPPPHIMAQLGIKLAGVLLRCLSALAMEMLPMHASDELA